MCFPRQTKPIPFTAQELLDLPPIIDRSVVSQKKKVGKGSTAAVYQAMYQGEQVAVKQIAMTDHRSKRRIRAYQELNVMNKLHQNGMPNTLKVYGFTSCHSALHIVMEYTSAMSIQKLLSKRKPLTWTTRLNIMLQIVESIAWMHSNDYVHCDIKPDNILIDENHIIKMIDMGSAKTVAAAKQGELEGTFWYLPREASCNTQATDIYSLSLTLYAIAAWNSRPFEYLGIGGIILPTDCPKKLTSLFNAGIFSHAKDRPTAQQIHSTLKKLA